MLRSCQQVAKRVKTGRTRPATEIQALVAPWFPSCQYFSDAPPSKNYPTLKPLQSISVPADLQDGNEPSRTTVLPRRRRQAMTNQEINTFNEMFNMIFAAVSEQTKAVDNVELQQDDIGQLFSKLRRHSRRKWTTEEESDLDRKKEEMERCDTDQQLLEWAMREMFDESVRQEAASRMAIQDAEESGAEVQNLPRLQSPAYPHLLALLMRTFRDRYKDPHLALAMFDHARNLSIVSYVFGCSTMAYNELIKTRWNCFRDLKGVHDALQEMSTNGVVLDKHTCKLVDDIVRDVGNRNLWTEEDPFGNSDEVWNLIHKMERLAARQRAKDQPKSATSKPKAKWDDWKSSDLTDIDEDIFGFDKWDTLPGRDRGTSASLPAH